MAVSLNHRLFGTGVWWMWIVLLCAVATAAGCSKGPLNKEGRRLFWVAHKNLEQGRYQEANRDFTQVIARNPNSWALSEVFYFRGLTRLRMGHRSEAKADFRQGASRYGRQLTQVYSAVALANLEYEEGNDPLAVHLYKQMLKGDLGQTPVDAVLFRLGVSLQRLGLWREADDTFAHLIDKYGDSDLRPAARRRFQASFFTVQVGAFVDRRNARSLAAKLRARKWPVTVGVAAGRTARMGKDKTYHTVSVGRYRTYLDARAVARKLKAKGHSVVIKP